MFNTVRYCHLQSHTIPLCIYSNLLSHQFQGDEINSLSVYNLQDQNCKYGLDICVHIKGVSGAEMVSQLLHFSDHTLERKTVKKYSFKVNFLCRHITYFVHRNSSYSNKRRLYGFTTESLLPFSKHIVQLTVSVKV